MIQDKATKEYMDQIKTSVARAESDKLISAPESEEPEPEVEDDDASSALGAMFGGGMIMVIWTILNWIF